jgi:predicted Zn-dependent protease
MTDKKVPDFDGLDWDAALDEWEKSAFDSAFPDEPSQTKRETARPHEPDSAAASAPRPLYKPGAPPAAPAAVPRPAPASSKKLPAAEPSRPGEAKSKGGLGQLFARGEPKPEPPKKKEADLLDPLFDEERTMPPQSLPPSMPQSPPGSQKPTPAPSRPTADETVTSSSEVMFDPFADIASERIPPMSQADTTEVAAAKPAGSDAPTRIGDMDELMGEIALPPPPAAPGPMTGAPRGSARRAPSPPGATKPEVRLKLHEPRQRAHDPDEETRTLDRDFAKKLQATFKEDPSFAPTTKVDDGLATKLVRASQPPPAASPSPSPAPVAAPPVPPPPPRRVERAPIPPGQVWEDEKPAVAYLDDWSRASFVERAEWLETEARAATDRHVRARGLVAVSEIRAILGQTDEAERLAAEARELSPQLAFAARQARWLAASGDPASLVEALDLEARHSTTPEARAHASLMAADVLRASGSDAEAAKRWDQAARLAPDDVRPVLGRAARLVGRGDVSHAAQQIPESPALAALADALRSVLRLRGADRVEAPSRPLPNEAAREARVALEQGDVDAAVEALARLRLPGLERAAQWLASAIGASRASSRPRAAELLAKLAETDELAQRALAARAIELGDVTKLKLALRGDENFTPGERAVLAVLADLPLADAGVSMAALESAPEMAPLAAAIASVRGESTATLPGSDASQRLIRLGVALAEGRSDADLDALLAGAADLPPLARALSLELAVRGGRLGEVADAVEQWSTADGTTGRDKELAAAFIAERAGNATRATAAYRAAHRVAPASGEAALRAILALDPEADIAADLSQLADENSSAEVAAILRLEAYARTEGGDDASRTELLDKAHRAAPDLPIAAFFAERVARRNGNVEEVLRWIRERRSASTDALDAALDAVREALLIADRDPELASERLTEAHRARPEDVALRELYERLATEPPADRAAWREERAKATNGPARALLFTEAAHEFERAGDSAGALRAAKAAVEAGDEALAKLAMERAEIQSGSAERLADELLQRAKSSDDGRERREAYERLAELDATARNDHASAVLWHRSILEEFPEHLPSLRFVEHALVSGGRDDELEPIAASIASALRGAGGGECSAHAWLGARLRMRTDADSAKPLAQLAAGQGEPPLWALRMLHGLARSARDDEAFLQTSRALVDRSTRPADIAYLLLRAGEAAGRLERAEAAKELLERAAMEDPGDVVTWGFLVEVRERLGDTRGAAEACESLARTSVVPDHQLLAWYDAARMWQDEALDLDRALPALEQAAMIDVAYEDIFERLAKIYKQRGQGSELAALLERRIARVTDPAQRVEMEVQRGLALAELGDEDGARESLETALKDEPDNVEALRALGDLCAKQGRWDAAEQAWVRLARLLPTPDEQRAVYARLGELYAVHAVNLSRAEVALKEVLKRAPNDAPTLERLVDVYRRQNDAARAVETQQQLIASAADSDARLKRLVELAAIYETVGRDVRKAEQTLESARKEFPIAVVALRALAEFYQRQRQMPAMHILLDRAAADARRAFAGGRFVPALFEVLSAVSELRGKKDAARVVAATLAAFEGEPSNLRGGELRALDPRLDDVVAPEVLGPALRALLFRTGDALDVAVPADLRAMRASPLPAGALANMIAQAAGGVGFHSIQIFTSPTVGGACVPCASNPPAVVLGDFLVKQLEDKPRAFLVIRALKLMLARASALTRASAAELPALVAAWFKAFNPSWVAPGVNTAALADFGRRLVPALPRHVDPDLGVIALEAAANLGANAPTLGAAALAWANRTALLAIGDPNAALDAIAWTQGAECAPTGAEARAAWISRTVEARELIAYSVTDAYAEARARLGLDKA